MKYILSALLMALLVAVIYFLPIESEIEVGDTDAQIQPSGRILQYGIYERVRGGNIVDSKVTTTGKAISRVTIQQVEQTQRIPAKKDVYFSYQYRLSHLKLEKGGGNGVINLIRKLKHPAITLPNGSVKSGSEYMIKGKVRRGEVFAFDGYAFNEDYELVEGEWIFQIWYRDIKLIEQKFISYLPRESGEENNRGQVTGAGG